MANKTTQTTRRFVEPNEIEFPPLDRSETKETITQTLDRLLGELNITAELVDDLRSKAFSEGEAKSDMMKDPGVLSLESQARKAASRAESINRNLKSILSRL